jgi:hypothetical protein
MVLSSSDSTYSSAEEARKFIAFPLKNKSPYSWPLLVPQRRVCSVMRAPRESVAAPIIGLSRVG